MDTVLRLADPIKLGDPRVHKFQDVVMTASVTRFTLLPTMSRSLLKFGGDPAPFTLLPDRSSRL
jgi:hypothetical protein